MIEAYLQYSLELSELVCLKSMLMKWSNKIEEANSSLPGGDCPEPLLPGGVPDLKLDGLSVQLDGADLEVDA